MLLKLDESIPNGLNITQLLLASAIALYFQLQQAGKLAIIEFINTHLDILLPAQNSGSPVGLDCAVQIDLCSRSALSNLGTRSLYDKQ